MHIRRIALGLLLALAACDETPVSLPEPAGVAVAGNAMTLVVGDAAPIAAQVVDQNGRVMQGLTPVFSTDNPSVATVGTDGVVRGMAPGTANVSAVYGGSTATVKVTVTAANVRVAVPAAAMGLVVGDAAPVAAQVLDQHGRVVPGAVPTYSTDNPGVAAVGMDGVVRGITPGTATVTAAHGNSTATVRVTVVANRRNELQTLEVLADSVVADRRAGVQVVAVRATNAFGQAVCPGELSLHSSDPSVATARMAGACRIEVTPLFAGEANITVTAGDFSDSFRVRVTSSGQIAFFSARPTSEELVAGATVSYTVKVLDQNNQPVANQRVNFEASVGALSTGSATTGEDGTATVQWQIPTHLQELGQNHTISFRAPLPNGTVAGRTETVFINGRSLHEILLYHHTGLRWTRLNAASITTPGWSYVFLGAGGLDQYGNSRVTDFTFSITGTYYGWACGGSGGTRDSSGIEYTCYYAPSGSTSTLRATAASGESKSVQVTFN